MYDVCEGTHTEVWKNIPMGVGQINLVSPKTAQGTNTLKCQPP